VDINRDDVALDRTFDMYRSVLRVGIRPHENLTGQISLRLDPPIISIACFHIDDIAGLDTQHRLVIWPIHILELALHLFRQAMSSTRLASRDAASRHDRTLDPAPRRIHS
jgi:hypothetical protein